MLSKILEKLIYKRLIKYINDNNILVNNQFGFRQGYSTCMALLLLQDKLTNAIDNGEYAIGLFLNLSKAFDTIDHKILADKLKFYGIRGVVLKWFESYLSNRKQFVSFNGTISEEMTIMCSVPQGSILGPLLFLLYINDLALTCDKRMAVLFADDTNLFITGKNLYQITEIMNTELIKVSLWLQVNSLSLNVEKTNYIIFSGKHRLKKYHNNNNR